MFRQVDRAKLLQARCEQASDDAEYCIVFHVCTVRCDGGIVYLVLIPHQQAIAISHLRMALRLKSVSGLGIGFSKRLHCQSG